VSASIRRWLVASSAYTRVLSVIDSSCGRITMPTQLTHCVKDGGVNTFDAVSRTLELVS
jgi:hypothetical protein